MKPESKIVVALDVDTVGKALNLVETLSPHVGMFKIGLEFITSILAQTISIQDEDEAFIRLRKIRTLFDTLEGKIFWDGKFDDIPNTIGKASAALGKLNVKTFNVHASASIASMMAAVANKGNSLVLAVTVLTSTSEEDAELIFGASAKAKVLQFARNAKLAGCDGLVCSSRELALFKTHKELSGLLKFTPGIRSEDDPPDDQSRTMTARQAIHAGADYLVIGRPIVTAPDPVAAAQKFASEINFAS